MNHKSRSGEPVANRLIELGFPNVQIMTDQSDYYLTRDKYRLAGIQGNYVNILRDFLKSGEDFALICQDDIEVFDIAYNQVINAQSKVESESIVMFYFFKNKSTLKGKASNKKWVKSTPNGLTMQMTMVSRLFVQQLLEWYDSNTVDGYIWETTPNDNTKVCGEDAFIQQYCKETKTPMWWHYPVLCKHGDVASSIGNGGGRTDW